MGYYIYASNILKVINMVKSSDLMGVVSDKEFNTACQKTRIRVKARQVAYDVLVAGLDIKEVAAKNKMSYQRVKNICERVHSEVGNDKMMEFSVKNLKQSLLKIYTHTHAHTFNK